MNDISEFLKLLFITLSPCDHEWKCTGFWRDRKEGEFEFTCELCRKQRLSHEPDKNSVIYQVSKF